MRVYVKAVGTNLTLVDVDNGVKFNVNPSAIEKLFGVKMNEGEMWDITATRREDIEQTFSLWQVIQQA
ncbi:MAG: hypothetical protein C4335_06540 [Armatimonadota bacterium]